MIGRTYLLAGETVTVVAAWRQQRKTARLAYPHLQLRPWTPKNVMLEDEQGQRFIRPFRGLRKLAKP